jgi:hypothetical protein
MWWYTGILIGGCYLQIVINFVVYQYHHQSSSMEDGTTSSGASSPLRFPFYYNNRHDDQPFLSEMLGKLSSLKMRAERLQQTPQEAYRDDGMFLPFTVRDAQKTVPTQIPYGFHVFDFIDVHKYDTYASMDDDDDDDDGGGGGGTSGDGKSPDAPFLEPLSFPAPLFYNGYPVPFPFNTSVVPTNSTFQEYSDRSNLLQVMRFLLEAPQFGNYSYFFIMESDHDLCISLSQLRSLAYQYRRYLIAVGTGSSGWIMSRAFLQDFYHLYKKQTSDDDLPPPDVVASNLLRRQNLPWSVTRRYLTSHSILRSLTYDDPSLTNLFEYDIDIQNITNVTTEVDGNHTVSANSTEAPSKMPKVELLPLMVPKVHLPRCLEPRRGKRPAMEEDQDDDDYDVILDANLTTRIASWDFFDYTQCPKSPIYPCSKDRPGSRKKLRGGGATKSQS